MPMKPVTLRRWEIVASFVALTVAFVVVAVLLSHANGNSNRAALQAKAAAEQAARVAESNRRAVIRLRRVKVSVGTLERGQCKLKKFLLSSAGVRTRLAAKETGRLRARDLHAAAVARRLGRSFANERCPS